MEEVIDQGFIDTGRWKEIDRTLKKVTQGDKELAERLSIKARAAYLVGFSNDYPDEEAINEGINRVSFLPEIFTIHLINPNLDYEYLKSMQSMLLNCIGLHKFISEKAGNNENYFNFKGELTKWASSEIHKENLDIVPIVDDNFASSEVARYCVFEHEGKKCCVNYFKTILDKYNELFKGMSEKDKEKLNKYIKQANDIFFNLKFGVYNFEASKIIDSSFEFLGENQFHRFLNQDFWNDLNSDKIHFKSKRLSTILNEVKIIILPHLHISVNGKDRFLNPNCDNIPMFKNVNKIHDYVKKIQSVVNRLDGLSSQVNENDLNNYQILKSQLEGYYRFFEDQYPSYVSFNEIPSDGEIYAQKRQFIYYLENRLSHNEMLRLLDFIDTINKPNLEKIKKIMKLIDKNSSSREQNIETLLKIAQMILVSDISIEVMYKNDKFGFKSLKGVIYQKPEGDIEYSSPGTQKININERLSVYLEDSTGQEYLKRMIFLPENIDISTAVYNKLKNEPSNSIIQQRKKEIAYILGIVINSDYYKSLNPQEKSNLISEIMNTEGIADILQTINFLLDKNKVMSFRLEYFTDPSNYVNTELRKNLVEDARMFNNSKGLIEAFYLQYEKDKKELENMKISLDKIGRAILPRTRRRKKQLLMQVDDLTKKQENFNKLLNKTLSSIYGMRCPEVICCISKVLISEISSEMNVYKLTESVNSGFLNVSDFSLLKNLNGNLEASIDKILANKAINNNSKLELIQLVFKIAQNDPTGLLTQNVVQALEVNINISEIYIKNIYEISQRYNDGEFPEAIHDLLISNNETRLYTKFVNLKSTFEDLEKKRGKENSKGISKEEKTKNSIQENQESNKGKNEIELKKFSNNGSNVNSSIENSDTNRSVKNVSSKNKENSPSYLLNDIESENSNSETANSSLEDAPKNDIKNKHKNKSTSPSSSLKKASKSKRRQNKNIPEKNERNQENRIIKKKQKEIRRQNVPGKTGEGIIVKTKKISKKKKRKKNKNIDESSFSSSDTF